MECDDLVEPLTYITFGVFLRLPGTQGFVCLLQIGLVSFATLGARQCFHLGTQNINNNNP